ncbi:MAG: hypothetical protein ACMVY4_15250 [Minwuia sp.]|uniref:hypothetical protein n=1 Tax=Minwuia sp. TaxID=2493630 RepID=UPI003A8AA1B8
MTARDDRTVELALASDGAFHADLPLGGGKWQADILVTGPAGETYRKIFHFEVEPGR